MSSLSSHHPKYRTKMCRNFASGSCPFGPKCSFVHAVPRISPPSFPLVPHLFHWNTLLPQLLALSNQQAALKKMMSWGQSSPPRPQGPQLVNEDLSPSTSLLLSTSDCTTSEQTPQKSGRFKKRKNVKRYPCRHFVRTGGWCPAGAQCKFLHDVGVLSADDKKMVRPPPFDTEGYGKQGRSISGGVLMGLQQSSPPTVHQEHSEPRYTEADLPQQSQQSVYWSNYPWQPYQPHYPALTAVMPMPTTAAPSSVTQHSLIPSVQTQTQTVPPETEARAHLPVGTYQMNGTTYFPASIPPALAPAPAPYPVPARPARYMQPMAPSVYSAPYVCYVPTTLPPNYYPENQTTEVEHPRAFFDPFASDRIVPNDLPVVFRQEDYATSPSVQHDVVPTAPCSLRGDLAPKMADADEYEHKPTTANQEHEFPYHPPKNQRIGHARRISVHIKKQGHAHMNSG